jgi:NADPH-dependent 7-cyano-7-deazaguanine reductase QueF
MQVEFDTVQVPINTVKDLTHVSFEFPFEVICAVPKKPFGGKITVSYLPRVNDIEDFVTLIEWNSLAEFFKNNRDLMLTAEQLASQLCEQIRRRVPLVYIDITVEVASEFHLPATMEAHYGSF